MAAQRRDEPGQAACGDNRWDLAQLQRHAVQDAVYHIHIAVDDAGPHAVNGILADDMAWDLQADVGKLGCLAAQGIEGNLESGQDDAPDIIPLLVHRAKGCGSAHVNDNKGQGMLMAGSHRVHDLVASNGLGVVHDDVHAGLHAGTHQQGGYAGDLFNGAHDGGVKGRDHGRQDGAFNGGNINGQYPIDRESSYSA